MAALKKLLILIFILAESHSFAQKAFKQTGKASFYADKFHGRQTASGERFDMYDLTAAHKTLPFGTYLKVTNLKNNKSVIVKVNDRGPYAKGRILDLSKAAAKKIDMIADGVANVKIEEVTNDKSEKSGAINKHRKPSKRIYHQGYYNHNFRKTSPSGFGVQIASYSDKQLAQENAKSYQVRYSEPVIIEATSKGYFRLIMGKFSSRSNAEKLQKQIDRKFKDCFVVEY